MRGDVRFAVEAHCDNRVVLADVVVADYNELNVIRRHAGCSQRHVFGDSIILAIAAVRCECFKGRAPAVNDAPLHEVAGRNNRQIDRTIDHADTGTTAARAALINNGKQPLRRQRT